MVLGPYEFSIRRGDTLVLDIDRLGDISGRDNLWFTVKDDKDKLDSEATIQIDENNGLLYIVGTAGTAANGSIVVVDAVAGNIGVTLEAEETAKIPDTGRWYYDVQMIAATTVTTLRTNRAIIIGDVSRAVD